ncbi:hypothetical protein NT6N_40240 [Oceaniferula spumae]|uniref:Fido domain-containing protein n=1 Tax=Oceaniferula spumae TaxID=2979115 RepID=A0AAT9FSQ9_9BACT
MPKVIKEPEYDELLEIVRTFPEGVSISGLLAAPEIEYAKRTLQRRLDALVATGRLTAVGRARARKYVSTGTALESDSNAESPSTQGSETTFQTVIESPPAPARSEPTISPPPAPISEAKSEPFAAAQVEDVFQENTPAISTEKLTLSFEAETIRESVNRPREHRQAVGHKLALLDYYKPNQSTYLNLALRQELATLGRVGASQAPAGTYLRQVMDRFLVDLSWNSSRLEGNSYSLQETQRLLARGEAAAGKGAEEAQMLLNHQAAVEMLSAQAREIDFNRHTICNLHALLADNLLPDPASCGRLRRNEVRISGTVYTPIQVPAQIEPRFEMILTKAAAIEDPFEQAFFIMVHVPYLQPFEHLNNDMSRVAANIPLVHFNLCPISFVDVPKSDYLDALMGVYELNKVDYLRDLFVWAYKRSAAHYAVAREYLGEPDPFRLKYRAEIRDLVRLVVRSRRNPSESGRILRQEVTKQFDRELQSEFLDVVETELAGLHEGNIARYRLKASEFEWWKSQKDATVEMPEANKKSDASQLDFEW